MRIGEKGFDFPEVPEPEGGVPQERTDQITRNPKISDLPSKSGMKTSIKLDSAVHYPEMAQVIVRGITDNKIGFGKYALFLLMEIQKLQNESGVGGSDE